MIRDKLTLEPRWKNPFMPMKYYFKFLFRPLCLVGFHIATEQCERESRVHYAVYTTRYCVVCDDVLETIWPPLDDPSYRSRPTHYHRLDDDFDEDLDKKRRASALDAARRAVRLHESDRRLKSGRGKVVND